MWPWPIRCSNRQDMKVQKHLAGRFTRSSRSFRTLPLEVGFTCTAEQQVFINIYTKHTACCLHTDSDKTLKRQPLFKILKNSSSKFDWRTDHFYLLIALFSASLTGHKTPTYLLTFLLLNRFTALLLHVILSYWVTVALHSAFFFYYPLKCCTNNALWLLNFTWPVQHETATISFSAHILCTQYNHAPVYS